LLIIFTRPGLPRRVSPIEENLGAALYRPPCAEFEVLKIQLQPHQTQTLPVLKSAAFYVIISGKSEFSGSSAHFAQTELTVKTGSCVFVAAGFLIVVKTASDPCLLFRANVNQGHLN
jgi:mannose-6-phosphate isomerase class I